MNPSQTTIMIVLDEMGVSSFSANDPTMPEGTIGVYFGPEPQSR